MTKVHRVNWITLSKVHAEDKTPQEQAGTVNSYSRGPAEHHQGRDPVMSMSSVLQTVTDSKVKLKFATKMENIIYDDYSVMPFT